YGGLSDAPAAHCGYPAALAADGPVLGLAPGPPPEPHDPAGSPAGRRRGKPRPALETPQARPPAGALLRHTRGTGRERPACAETLPAHRQRVAAAVLFGVHGHAVLFHPVR